ncbi:MAG: RES family NAD+ phosphorylase [Acidobacteria bacterium]|nr:RES family NAD+ phosphorylase [Acidobacteriota bacterium]
MIAFRHADPRFPFLWEASTQPAGRWHAEGEGPAHYFADTPDGAWAELLRHEEIVDADDLPTIRRALWAVDLGDEKAARVRLEHAVATGDDTYDACQAYATRQRARGVRRLLAPSAALQPGGATGVRVEHGELPATPRDGLAIVIFGDPAALTGWQVVDRGSPPARVLERVRHLAQTMREVAQRP